MCPSMEVCIAYSQGRWLVWWPRAQCATEKRDSIHFLDSGGSNWCYPEVDCRLAAEARYRDHPGGWQAK